MPIRSAGVAVYGVVVGLIHAVLEGTLASATAVRQAAELTLHLLGLPHDECGSVVERAVTRVAATASQEDVFGRVGSRYTARGR